MLIIANTAARIYTTYGIKINPGINKINCTDQEAKKYLEHPGVKFRLESGVFILMNAGEKLNPFIKKQVGDVVSIDGEVKVEINVKDKDHPTQDDFKVLDVDEVEEQSNEPLPFNKMPHAQLRELINNTDSIDVLEEILDQDQRKPTHIYAKARIDQLKKDKKG